MPLTWYVALVSVLSFSTSLDGPDLADVFAVAEADQKIERNTDYPKALYKPPNTALKSSKLLNVPDPTEKISDKDAQLAVVCGPKKGLSLAHSYTP